MTTRLPHPHLLILAALASLGAQALPAAAQSPRVLSLAVSEGTSGGIDAATARRKYAPLAQRLEQALGDSVEVVFVREFAALEQGMKDGRYDFVVARPSDYPARGLRDHHYQYVANAEPDGQCMLAVRADSPVQSLEQLRGKTFVMPEEVAYMARFCRAELRDKSIDLAQENVFYVREQGAIPFGLESGIADVGGMASYSEAFRQWRGEELRVLHRSVGQPRMPVVAAPTVSAEHLSKARKVLLELPQDAPGREFLRSLGISGFTDDGEERLRKLLTWLGV